MLAGYRRWGADVVDNLGGEFALLIWDEAASTLVAARDPFGVRPLFYARPGGRFVAASDPEQILATGLVPAQPDDHTVIGHLLWEFHDSERSFFREIRRLPPGHLLIANRAGHGLSTTGGRWWWTSGTDRKSGPNSGGCSFPPFSGEWSQPGPACYI